MSNPTTRTTAGVLPDERFWKRYSAHQELPLSATGSFLVHALAIGSLVLAAWAVSAQAQRHNRVPEQQAVFLGDGAPGDGGVPEVSTRPEAAMQIATPTSQPNAVPPPAPLLPPPAPDTVKVEITDPSAAPVASALRTDVGAAAQSQLDRSPRKPSGSPTAGRGPIGGGPSGKLLTDREIRQKRWSMFFNTSDGRDYLKQLRALGASLAVPLDTDRFLVIRDLSRPTEGKIESIDVLEEQMRWEDVTPNSLRKLAEALQISPPPSVIRAYFPRRLEEMLHAKELTFLKMQRPLAREYDILETHFALRPRPSGGFEPHIIEQRLK